MKLQKIDTAKIEDGVWIGDIPDMGDLRLKVRGTGNARFRRLQQELINAVPRAERRKGRLDPLTMDRITGTCLARTVLIDWEHLEDDAGQPIPFSEAKATEFLTDPSYRPFYEAVLWASTVVSEEDAEADKEDEGNSAKPSAGA